MAEIPNSWAPPATAPGSGARSARTKRTEHSSSHNSEAGEFQVSNVRFRAAAPPAFPSPIQTAWNHPACQLIRTAFGPKLERGVTEIVLRSNIKLKYPEDPAQIVFRYVEGEEESTGQPTVVVIARWDEACGPEWERTVIEAKRFIDGAKVAATGKLDHLDIGVELIAPELTRTKFVSYIPETESTKALATDWEAIRAKVSRILGAYPATKGKVTSIALFKLGFSDEDRDKNHLTIYISVSYDSPEARWSPAIQEIQQHLDSYPYGLTAHIEHNDLNSPYESFDLLLKPLTDERLKCKQGLEFHTTREYKTRVELGEDISPATYLTADSGEKFMPRIGTLGC
ncbi:uncharacterized protein C8A04DRAFT_25219 [Dichotomopilus funicola]|uniref:Uncharacterized protein n=1 Tax=Dichotomopilus funicola TaxID=1934379 RepID=A0AAN6ZR67_9PEZI|nr:hypothetical protein C8A04DRAFT_25219 [Dichotomopilus funicola]